PGVRWRRCRLLPGGNLDAKDRAAAIRIVETDGAAQSLDDLFDDAQPKAGAALLTRVRVIGLRKLVKDSRLEFLGNAVAMVAHGDQDPATPAFDRNHDFLAPRGEFDRVGEKIGDDLHEPIRIGANIIRRRRGVQCDAHAVLLGESEIAFDGLRDERANCNAFQGEYNLAGIDLLHVEDAVDEPAQSLAVCMRDREQAHRGCGQRAAGMTDQKAKRAGNGSERGAKFVAYRRYELVLQPLDAETLADIDDH